MTLNLFGNSLTQSRSVQIPRSLNKDKRGAFIEAIRTAVEKQAALATKCDAILAVEPRIDVQESFIRIRHQAAYALSTRAILEGGARPDIRELWWISEAGLRALQAATAAGLVHGGIQPGAFTLDELGRVRLTGFGVAPAVENALGADGRRMLALVDAEEGGESSAWRVLGEHDRIPHGWITPYFSHEQLDGRSRLNSAADQFALGVAVFLLATGTHPFGADISDPTLSFYFHLEPYALDEERKDWREVFKREAARTALAADRPILDWSRTVNRLLASDPADRFGDLAEALRIAGQHIPGEWAEARESLTELHELLAQDQFAPFLSGALPWSENAELPAPWRAALVSTMQRVERDKDAILELRGLEKRLDDAIKLSEAAEPDAMRRSAAEAEAVAADPRASDLLRERAREHLGFVQSYIENIERNAPLLADHHLELAAQKLRQREFDEARRHVRGVLSDAQMRRARQSAADEMVARIDAAEAQDKLLKQAFAQARAELESAQFESAERRLAALREGLDDAYAAEMAELSAAVDQALARREEYRQLVASVQEALDRGNADAARQALEELPFDVLDPWIIEQRDELSARCEKLAAAIDAIARAESALAAGDERAALERLAEARASGPSPALLERIGELTTRAEQALAEKAAARRQAALEALAAASAAWDALDANACDAALAKLNVADLPPEEAKHAAALKQGLVALRSGLEKLEAARRAQAAERLVEAQRELGQVDLSRAPDALREQVEALRAETRVRMERNAAELNQALLAAQQAWERLDCDACERALKQPLTAPSADTGTREDAERLLESSRALRTQLALAEEVGAALKKGRLAEAEAGLRKVVEAGLPDAFAQRIAALREEVGTQAAAAHEQARALLAEAVAAWEACDVHALEKLARRVTELALAPEDVRAEGKRLLDGARTLASDLQAFEKAEKERTAGRFEAARKLLEGVNRAGPKKIQDERESLAERIAQDEAGRRAETERACAAELDAIDADLQRGAIKEAAKRLTRLDLPPLSAKSLQERRDRLQTQLGRHQQSLAKIEQVEAALKKSDGTEAAALLRSIESAPEWAKPRIAQLNQQVAAAQEASLQKLLDQAEQRVAAADADGAARLLKQSEEFSGRAELVSRRTTLTASVEGLRQSLDQFAAARELEAAGRLREAHEALERFLQQGQPPPALRKDAQSLQRKITEALAKSERELGAQLDAIEGELRGAERRPRGVLERIARVASDPLISPALAQRAASLRKQAEALRPTSNPAAMAAVAVVVVAVLAVGGYFVINRPQPTPTPLPTPLPNPDPQPTPQDVAGELARALPALQAAFERQEKVAEGQGRDVSRGWKLAFTPPDSTPAALVAVMGDERVELMGAYALDQQEAALARIASLPQDEAVWASLFPEKSAPPPPSPGALLAERLPLLQKQMDALAEQAAGEGRNAVPWRLSFAPPDATPANVIASRGAERMTLLEGYDPAQHEQAMGLLAALPRDAQTWEALFPKSAAQRGPLPAQLANVSGAALDDGAGLAETLKLLMGERAPRDLAERAAAAARLADSFSLTSAEEGEDRAIVTLSLRPRLAGDAASAPFTLRWADGAWTPADNAAALNKLLGALVDAIAAGLDAELLALSEDYQRGRLIAAWRRIEAARGLEAPLRALAPNTRPTWLERLDAIAQRLPAQWSAPPPGFTASAELDPDAGYPLSLSAGPRTLRLINASPASDIWKLVAGQRAADEAVGGPLWRRISEGQAPWELFYIEEGESPATAADQAEAALAQTGLRLPTPEEWLIATLSLRGEPAARTKLCGGLWDWAQADGMTWLVGGCDELHKDLLPWPKASADGGVDFGALWAWANDPLVSQPRAGQFGDELAGYRGVWRP